MGSRRMRGTRCGVSIVQVHLVYQKQCFKEYRRVSCVAPSRFCERVQNNINLLFANALGLLLIFLEIHVV